VDYVLNKALSAFTDGILAQFLEHQRISHSWNRFSHYHHCSVLENPVYALAIDNIFSVWQWEWKSKLLVDHLHDLANFLDLYYN
jgi:hypothetical protein